VPTPVLKRQVAVLKTDAKLGLVFGFAIVCKVKNADGEFEPYYDTGSYDEELDQVFADHITEEAMMEAATAFMKSQRVVTEDHERDENDVPVKKGQVVHSMTLTEALVTELGMDIDKTGWLIAIEPTTEMFKRYESGELNQFSIGGGAIREPEKEAE
jgi:hypothetical protein